MKNSILITGASGVLGRAIVEAGLNSVVRAGYAAGVTGAVEEISGRPPVSFKEFAKAARWQ